MVPYWLKPNKVGIALFIVSAILILYVFSFFDIILLNPPFYLRLAIFLLVAYPISMILGIRVSKKIKILLGGILSLLIIILPNQPFYLSLVIFVSVAYPISMILGIRVGKKMKILLGVALVGMLSLLIFLVCPIYSSLVPNCGFPFGYYGQFNRVKHRLKQIGGIHIYGYHHHKDILLEDFWFFVRTKGGLKLDLQFSHVAKTYELFDHADGLGVMTPDSGKRLLYSFSPGGRLETVTSKEIRNAVDVLENFDKIAEVIDSDRQKGLPGGLGWQGVPKSYFCIIFPSFYLQPIE